MDFLSTSHASILSPFFRELLVWYIKGVLWVYYIYLIRFVGKLVGGTWLLDLAHRVIISASVSWTKRARIEAYPLLALLGYLSDHG